MSDLVIEVANLAKHYGDITAAADVSLQVEPGTVFGLVGPNGAGKSTTIECIQGLRVPDSGTVQVLGRPPREHRRDLFRHIGVLPQHNELLPARLRVGEAVDLWRSFHDNPLSKDDTLALCGLEDRRKTRTSRLSGGQRRRLMIALAQVGRPRLLILDDATSAVDPAVERAIFDGLAALDTTVILVAYRRASILLADEVIFIEEGRVTGRGTHDELFESVPAYAELIKAYEADDR